MRRKIVFSILAFLFCCCVSLLAQSAPQDLLSQKLHAKVHDYELSADSLLEGLAKFSSDFDLPMGIEWELSRVPSKPVHLVYEQATVTQVLQDLIAVEPPYAFAIANGVIHVGKDALSHDSRNFLNISIREFDLSDEYVFHANNRLRQEVAELANGIEASNPRGGCAGSSTVGAGDRKATFDLQDTTVRDILDRFVTSAGFSIWLVTFPEIKATTPKGFFKTVSVFASDLPENVLPAWDLLMPGYDPEHKRLGLGWRRTR